MLIGAQLTFLDRCLAFFTKIPRDYICSLTTTRILRHLCDWEKIKYHSFSAGLFPSRRISFIKIGPGRWLIFFSLNTIFYILFSNYTFDPFQGFGLGFYSNFFLSKSANSFSNFFQFLFVLLSHCNFCICHNNGVS